MKIQKVTLEHRPKVYALLQRAFPGSSNEEALVRRLHEQNRSLHEWVCIHTNKVIAYIAFSTAYHGRQPCGLHLAPLAVAPDFQKQGVASELLRFALRQEAIKEQPLFVLGASAFFQRFGFTPCSRPLCHFDNGNTHFMAMRSEGDESFTVGYEPEFSRGTAGLPSKAAKRGHRR